MKPLEGVKVLELSKFFAGPFLTQTLADFGAEVIKIEDPRGGDPSRKQPPLIGGEGTAFYAVNRNKKSVTINLKSPEGQKIFKSLVAQSDVVLDQMRPGYMDNLELGYKALKEINPRLIYCSVSGYGSTGPLRDEVGHDINFQSMAGIVELNGRKDEAPLIPFVQTAATAGGVLYGVMGILLALLSRERTGRGQFCDVSMVDGSISLLNTVFAEMSGWGKMPARGEGVLTGGLACYNLYPTKDGRWISIGAIEGKFWADFCRRIGREDLIAKQWTENQTELTAAVCETVKQKDFAEWQDIFADSNTCVTPVLNLKEVAEHPQTVQREMVYRIKDIKGLGVDLLLTGIPVKLSETPGEVKTVFPEIGEHNEEIFAQLGVSQEEMADLKTRGII